MVIKDAMKKLLYTDDLALVANGKQELRDIEREPRTVIHVKRAKRFDPMG